MRFSQSTHLLMCLFLETLMSIIRTGLPILVILIDLVKSVIIFLSQTKMYQRLLAGFGILVFFTNLSSMGMVLDLLFSVVDGFRWFWMGSLHNNDQLMLEFHKTPFLVLHFSYYTLMSFPVILLSMLDDTTLSILSVIRHLTCGKN